MIVPATRLPYKINEANWEGGDSGPRRRGVRGRRPLYKTVVWEGRIIIFLSRLILINRMGEKEMSLIERMRLAREMKALQCELGDCLMQLQFKDNKIQELQRMVVQLQDSPIQENILIEQEIQCALPQAASCPLPHHQQPPIPKEEQDSSPHPAAQHAQQHIDGLTAALQAANQLAEDLQQELAMQQEAASEQQLLVESLKAENQQLQQLVEVMEEAAEAREEQGEKAEADRQNLRILQENRATLQHIMLQNEKSREESAEREEAMGTLERTVGALERERAALLEEREKMKKIINNYDWKLFCLETELDLSAKEKKQYKYVNEKHEARVAELEALSKQNTIKLFSLEEEVKALEEQNRYYEAELDARQTQLDQLAQQQSDTETVKELEYRVREKEEELHEMSAYLKEKLREQHEMKLRCAQLEKAAAEAHRKLEKAEQETYEAEQCLIENDQIMQRQAQRIDDAAKEADFLNDKVNELALINMLRAQECDQRIAALQTALNEQTQRNNQLSVEMAEREDQLGKHLEDAQAMAVQLTTSLENEVQAKRELVKEGEAQKMALKEQVARAEAAEAAVETAREEAEQLEGLLGSRNAEMHKLVGKLSALEGSVREKERLVTFLQGEVRAARAEFKEARLACRRLEEELEEMREVAAVSEEKLKILKIEAVDNIETELNSEYEIGNLRRQLAACQEERAFLAQARLAAEKELGEARETSQRVAETAKARVQEMVGLLLRPLDETTTFEVLDEEDFEPMEDVQERERKAVLEVAGQLQLELSRLCGDAQ